MINYLKYIVLNIGFRTNKFENIKNLDFERILVYIDFMYGDSL